MSWQGARDEVAAAVGSAPAFLREVGTKLLDRFNSELQEYASTTRGDPEPVETAEHATWRTTTMPAILSAQRALAHAYDGKGTADTSPAAHSLVFRFRDNQTRLKEAAALPTTAAPAKDLLTRAASVAQPPEPNMYARTRAASGPARAIANTLDRLEAEAEIWLGLVSP